MDELLIALIRWSKIAALAAVFTTIIVLVAHWHGLTAASGAGNAPVAQSEIVDGTPAPTANATAPAPNANNCGCETATPTARPVRPQFQAWSTDRASAWQPGEAAVPVIGTPAVNMQWAAAPTPPAPAYSGPEWQYSVTVGPPKKHHWPRRMIGGIGRGFVKVFTLGRH